MSRDATPADVLSGAARWCVVEGDALALLASQLGLFDADLADAIRTRGAGGVE